MARQRAKRLNLNAAISRKGHCAGEAISRGVQNLYTPLASVI